MARKRIKTTREKQNVKRLDNLMARMILDLRKDQNSTLVPAETELVLKILAYALQRMTQDLQKGEEDEQESS
jgi:hypothetical protein